MVSHETRQNMGSIKALNINVTLAYYILIVFSPLSWISLTGVGDSSIKLVHLSLLPLIISCLFTTYQKAIIRFVTFNKYIISFFLLLMLMNFVSLAVDTNIDSFSKSMTYIIKNLSYLSLALFFGGMMIVFIDSPGFIKNLSISNALCVIIFITVASITFKATGGNFLLDLFRFFFSGDIDGLRRELYKTIFITGNTNEDAEMQVNLINSLTGSFIIVHFISLYAFNNTKNKIFAFLNIFSFCFSLFFVISSISRSNIFALLFGYAIYWGCEIIFNKNTKKIFQLFATSLVVLSLTLIFWSKIQTALVDTSDMYAERFGGLDDNIRWSLNAEAIQTFTATPLNFIFGKGSGAELPSGHAVHNFIIGSAYQAGIFGLILSVLFYAGLIFSVIKYAPDIKNQKAAFIISALMSIPVLRMMESGDAGSLTLQEWFCVAIFIGFVIKKKSLAKDNLAGQAALIST